MQTVVYRRMTVQQPSLEQTPASLGATPAGKAIVLFAYAVFFLSGIAGLGYEIVWTRMFAVGLGHELPSMLAVVAAFFGGLALGAWGLDGAVSRSPAPGRWYAGLEACIGLWALATIALVPALNGAAARLAGVEPSALRQWLVAFGVPFVGLLPATAAMGATLPAMERLCARLRRSGRTIAGLYAANTAGAVAGTVGTTFLLIPAAGYARTLAVLALVNGACAAGIALGPARGERQRPPEAGEPPAGAPGAAVTGVTLLATGPLGIGYEVLGVRVMAQVLEDTVYSFASALSVYLLGTAAGAALYQRLGSRAGYAAPLAWLLQGLCLSCLGGLFVLAGSSPIYERVRESLGATAAASVAAEMVLAALVFGAPSVLMGATFSHLAQASRRASGGVGRALGLNTIGAAMAPAAFGVGLLPWLGARWAITIVALSYLALLLLVPRLRAIHVVPSALAVPLIALAPGSLVLVEAPPGTRIAAYREGVMGAVSVIEAETGDRVLKVNNRFQMGGTAQPFADRRQAHIPLLLHPGPRSALFLGLGTGITAGAATDHPGLEVTGVELLPEVVELMPWFAPANRLNRLGPGSSVVADARRYVRADDKQYDVIVGDLFHPSRDGAGSLYTLEHFRAIAERLEEGGIFCQWLPLYQLDDEVVRLIARTFLAAFPDAVAVLAHFNAETPMLGLVAGTSAYDYGGAWYEKRVAARGLPSALQEVALGNGLTLFGCLVAGTGDLAAYAGEGPLNTDDRPEVVFRAPAFTYRKDQPGWGRLATMMAECRASAGDLLSRPDDPAGQAFAGQLDRYLAARDLYLGAEILLHQGRTAAGIQAMLDSVRASPEFRTAYLRCLQIALDGKDSDPRGAQHLLSELAAANPADPMAARYLRDLVGAEPP